MPEDKPRVRLKRKLRRPPRVKLKRSASYACPACFESNTAFYDLGGAESQRFTQDCRVCCRPSLLTVTKDETTDEWFVTAERE